MVDGEGLASTATAMAMVKIGPKAPVDAVARAPMRAMPVFIRNEGNTVPSRPRQRP